MLGALLLAVSFAGGIFYGDGRWSFVVDLLFWIVLVGSVAFHGAVSLLRKLGMLEFTYTDADRSSYFYSAEETYRQMKELRRTKKE